MMHTDEFYDEKLRILIGDGGYRASPYKLAEIYENLLSMTSEDRNAYIAKEKNKYIQVLKAKDSNKTLEVIQLLLTLQYLSRYKYNLHVVDWSSASENLSKRDEFGRHFDFLSDSHIVESICDPVNPSEKIASWSYSPPSLVDFLDLIFPIVDELPLRKIIFICTYGGINLPNAIEKFDDWCQSNSITEKNWGYHYERRMEKLSKRWFKSKSSMQSLNDSWEEQRQESSAFMKEVQNIFHRLDESQAWLNELEDETIRYEGSLGTLCFVGDGISNGASLTELIRITLD